MKKEAKQPIEDMGNRPGADISVKLKGLIGVAELPNNFDDRKVLNEYFENKHLRNQHK